jgi:U3 small nucleolar ribonucleoprotein protein IMP3
MSLRKLKYHESKLLKKVDFLQWKSDDNIREIQVPRRYHIQRREEYIAYNRIVGQIHALTHKIIQLDAADVYRIKVTQQLLDKLFNAGLIPTKRSLSLCKNITVSSFCRRRLSVILVRLKMCESIKQAVELIEHGHIRVGVNQITDPAYLVTRTMEDFVQWVDGSKIQRTIHKYNNKLDDFILLGN